MEELTLREWIKNFNEGVYERIDLETQMKAGWYDWFCKDKSLRNKTNRMGNIIKQIKDGGKVDLDKTYVWFKNNCLMVGGLYDDFRIANIEDDESQLVVQLDLPDGEAKYIVYGIENDFSKALFETNSSRVLVKWLNNEI